MGREFNSSRKINFLTGDGYTIRRVSRSMFAHGKDVVVAGNVSLLGAAKIGKVTGLNEGDVIKIYPDGRLVRLWDSTSIHNCLFVTGLCNFKCEMCPQPPCEDDPDLHKENLEILRLLKPNSVSMIGITGGEPTIFPDRLIEYFDIINERFPTARTEVLTNGSIIANFDVAKRLALAAPYDICYCVSIHGDTASLAESIMHVPGGWDKALRGMMNLAKLQQPIEIRIVITQKNHSYLNDMAYFISRNFPFASHIAFMGQEITGCARENYNQIWVEPLEYKAELERAVLFLAALDFNVSIYNVPLCLLPSSCYRYAARSISDWKQSYLDACRGCAMEKACCGFFTTSGKYLPKGIVPLHEKRGDDALSENCEAQRRS